MRCARLAGGRRADHGAAAWRLSNAALARGASSGDPVAIPVRRTSTEPQFPASADDLRQAPFRKAATTLNTEPMIVARFKMQSVPTRQGSPGASGIVAGGGGRDGLLWEALAAEPEATIFTVSSAGPTSDRTADRCALTRAQALLSLGSCSAAHSGNPSSSRAALRPDFASSRTASSAYTQNGPRQ